MTQKPTKQIGKRAVARLRAIRRQAAAWRRRTQRALTLALIVACGIDMPSRAFAQQVGQSAMAPAGGVVNRAVAGFQDLNTNGPGLFYYGINAADRGLGYNGSYMTFGGFVPYAEDDLGGAWSADLRSHLSGYGGFFSNVGIVRKQFVGGALSGIGVYWDYDGDANQYPNSIPATMTFGSFTHTYQQVGISGEFLTDFGSLRSNGYIPVGSTAFTAGSPYSNFYQNFVMCQNGLDAALAGVDLEVGAYVPGLADWGGMVSVGGYSYGNARYTYPTGQAVVPYFGGVYTRLDMTFIENWDFSLQYNNDSFFDSTGFARLTYRMGGSRRRNVPDQMEQPMMRNEHIVRAHQQPIIATNADNGGEPWRVIHVNNKTGDTALAGANGSAQQPFNTIAEGNVAATNAWDIVLVSPGTGTATGYDTTFSPLASNQFFIGDGSPFYIPTQYCGLENIATGAAGTPLLTNPTGASINLQNGLVVNNFNIQNSAIGISGTGPSMSGGVPRASGFLPPYASAAGVSVAVSVVTNVAISGNGTANQQGIFIKDAAGAADFRDVSITGMSTGSVAVDGGDPVIDFREGTITNTIDNLLQVSGTTGGSVTLVSKPATPFVETGDGIIVENASGDVTVVGATITSKKDGIRVAASAGNQNFNDIAIKGAGGIGYAGVNLQGNSGATRFNNLTISTEDSTGFLAVGDNLIDVSGTSSVSSTNAPALSLTTVADADITFNTVASTNSTSNGVLIDGVKGAFTVNTSLTVINPAADGFVVKNSPDLTVSVPVTTVTNANKNGVVLQNNDSTDATKVSLGQLTVTTKDGAGLIATNASATVSGGTIDATGGASISANTADLDVTLVSATSTDSLSHGLNLTAASGELNIATTTVTTPAVNGINAVDNVAAFKADFGSTKVVGIANGAVGVNITNTTDPTPDTVYSFNSLDVTTVDGTGMLAKNGGTINVNGSAQITAAGGAAINLENTTGTTSNVVGSGFTFLNLTSTDSVTNGIRLNNLNSNLTVTGATNIVGAAATSILITDTLTPPATNSISFNTIAITSRNNIGMVVDGVYGQVQIASLTIDNANSVSGNAVEISNTTNPAFPTGIQSGRVYINGGAIDGSLANDIQVTNALAAITGTTISGSTAQGILAQAGSGQQTTVTVSNSSITSTIGIDGLRLQATGGGIVNATLATTLIDVPQNPLNAIVFDGTSSIFLNAFNNSGTGGTPPLAGSFVLNNNGALQIDQPSTADLSLSNNGVTVSVLALPPTFGATTPIVPPPTP